MQDLAFEKATVTYDPAFLPKDRADQIFTDLSTLFESEQRKTVTDDDDNVLYKLNRKTLVFVDKDVPRDIIPKIWGSSVGLVEFSPVLLEIKAQIESMFSFKFNICLANYYNSGKNAIGYHSDNEEKGSISCIASISLGAERMFSFRRADDKTVYKEFVLRNGSLLMMGPGCQENYEHSLPGDKSCKQPRLNLTFRLFDSSRYINY